METVKIGLPKIQISFTDSAKTILPRSERGIVLVLAKKNASASGPLRFELDSNTVEKEDVIRKIKEKTDKGAFYAIQAVRAGASKVILHLIDAENTLEKVLATEKTTKYNYMCFPEAEDENKTAIVQYIKKERMEGKGKKALLFNAVSPNEKGIINFCTAKVKIDTQKNDAFKIFGTQLEDGIREVDGADYSARIAGTLAGMGLEISPTYFVLSEVVDCSMSETPDADIDAGKLILIHDGEKVKIARGVNSLSTGTDNFKKIKIVDGMDLILEDIKKIFNDEFIGKMVASYDNKMGFIDAINGIYFRRLEGTVLEPTFRNRVELDLEAVKEYMRERGIKVENYEEAEVKAFPTGSTLFLKGSIKLLDALEDLELKFVI